MTIKIFGPGCVKCQTLTANVEGAIAELGFDGVTVEKISEIDKIVEHGIMGTPALMIDGEIKASGRVPSVDEIKVWVA